MDFRGLVWKRAWKLHFWSEIGSGFGEPGGTPPPRITRGTPPDSRSLFEVARIVVSLTNVAIWHDSIQGRFCDENSLRNCNETLQTWFGAFYSHFSCAVTIVIFLSWTDKILWYRYRVSTWDIRYSAPYLIYVWKILSSSSSRPYLVKRFCFCSINLKNRDWIEEYVYLEHYSSAFSPAWALSGP